MKDEKMICESCGCEYEQESGSTICKECKDDYSGDSWGQCSGFASAADYNNYRYGGNYWRRG